MNSPPPPPLLLNPISKHRGTLISSLSPSPFTQRLRAGRVGVRKSHRSHHRISDPHTRTYKRVLLEEVTVQPGESHSVIQAGQRKAAELHRVFKWAININQPLREPLKAVPEVRGFASTAPGSRGAGLSLEDLEATKRRSIAEHRIIPHPPRNRYGTMIMVPSRVRLFHLRYMSFTHNHEYSAASELDLEDHVEGRKKMYPRHYFISEIVQIQSCLLHTHAHKKLFITFPPTRYSPLLSGQQISNL